MGRVRMPLGVLNHLTAANGPAIVRGHRMPADLQGDLLFAEPVGRLVRRAKIVKTEGLTQLRNPYPGSEFLLSSDLCFRPVNIRTAPDGSIYIADMYHGIIQESTWTKPGSYLRRRIEQYQLDKVVDHGRIWRLRYDGVPAVTGIATGAANATAIDERPAVPAIALDTTQPRMLNETPAQLVAHLTHPNGWWRDTAQRLLVLKQDKSVVPALQQMARSSDSLVGRFHAMWTLEGLGALDAALVREPVKDPNPRMRVQAIRASETLYKAGNKSFDADYRALTKDADADVSIQAMLTLSVFGAKDLADVVKAAQAANTARGVKDIGNQLVTAANNAAATTAARANLTPEQRDLMERGGTIFNELCFTCHGTDGRGAPLAGAEAGVTMGPPLSGSPRVQGHRDYVDQGAAERADRPGRREDLHRSHGADGRQQGRMDRRRSRPTSATASATRASTSRPPTSPACARPTPHERRRGRRPKSRRRCRTCSTCCRHGRRPRATTRHRGECADARGVDDAVNRRSRTCGSRSICRSRSC